ARRQWEASAPEARDLTDRLRRVRGELARVVLAREAAGRIPPEKERAEYDARLLALTAEKEKLERTLAAAAAPFRHRRAVKPGDPADLAAKPPATTAVVEFVRVQRWERYGAGLIPKGGEKYEAFVLRQGAPGGPPSVARVDLGDAEPIDRGVADWRAMF